MSFNSLHLIENDILWLLSIIILSLAATALLMYPFKV